MKKFLGIICFIYALLIIYVWLSGNLGNYIAPNMQMYIKCSIVPLVIMGLVLILNNKINYKFKVSDIVLLLPIILILFAGDGNLTIGIAKVKATNRNREKNITVDVDPVPADIEPVEDTKKEKIEDFYFEIVDSNYSYLADYLTYMAGAKKYVGKTIKFVGFAVDYSDYLTDDYSAIGRYMITCCAADSEFTGFMTKYSSKSIKYGSWYEVEGYLEMGKDKEGYDVMTVNPVSVVEISQNDLKQYVYSCNTYGNKACEELQKYDLEY